jgi:K+-transporting ATPase ATPase C chain
MTKRIIQAVLATLVLAVLTGLVYPFVMTGFAQVAFKSKADGSLVYANGTVVGSSLIGQQWAGKGWFYGRLSATSTPYDAAASSGSNLGPNSQTLASDILQRVRQIEAVDGPYHPGLTASQIPVDLLTSSGSGLDPNISPQAAYFQAPRIAAVRNIPLSQVSALIERFTSSKTFGFLGEPRVNVLELNLALARLGSG